MGIDHRYDAHDTEIHSDLALPELSPARRDGRHQVLTISEDETLSLPVGEGEHRWVDPAGFHVTWDRVGTFRVSPAGDITYRRLPGASDDLIRIPLLGSVLAVALCYRGTLVLHGNAVSVGGNGVLLLGAKGQGKSTLSAALVARGHRVQAEDAASVSPASAAAAEVFRGMRQLRLWPDAVDPSFNGSHPGSRPIHELSSKRVFPLADQGDVPDRLPLARVYVLEDADAIDLQPLAAAEAWPLLLVHAFVTRFGTELLTGALAARHFAACAALARAVPCVRLRRPRDFSRLGDVCARLEQDLRPQA